MGWLTTITWIYSAAAVFLWLVAFASGTASMPTDLAAWGSILGMGLIAQLVGHSALNWCLNHFTAGQVAMSTLLEPVFAAALAWLIFGERITLAQGVGSVLLLAGVGIALSSNQSPDQADRGTPCDQPCGVDAVAD
jgi:drug/metabolite transporter (DMT)-like permease